MKYTDNECDRRTGRTTARMLLALGYACLAPGTEVEFQDHMPNTPAQLKRHRNTLISYITGLNLPARAVLRGDRLFVFFPRINRQIYKMDTTTQGVEVRKLTKYPTIFNGRWGSFDSAKNPDIGPEIIEARNKFVEENGIVKQCNLVIVWDLIAEARKSYSSSGYSMADHSEMYYTETGGIILICSNYGKAPPARLGMTQYNEPLYSPRCRTFIRLFVDKAEVRALLKSLKAENAQTRDTYSELCYA